MNAEAASLLLVQATLASSVAALLVIGLRKLLHRAIGARAACWLWLFVPFAALALVLPQPERSVEMVAPLTAGPVRAAVSDAMSAIVTVAPHAHYAWAVLWAWIAGALLSFALTLRRHHTFLRELGEMQRQSDGSMRASACNEPLLLGVFRPRLVLPPDFDLRYGANERAMVLAHEQAHLHRHDPLTNAAAHVWVCLSWFNPLMYWALRLFRFDQELACDASVLALPGATPRRYADALLKTQLAADLARKRATMGCHWHSFHPLAERIHMLKHPLPGALRRRTGFVLMLALVASGCYAVRTAQSQAATAASDRTPIAINLKIFENGVDMLTQRYGSAAAAGWDVITDGQGFFALKDQERAVNCTARLPAPGRASPTGESFEGTIIISCKLSHAEQVFASPTLLVRDSVPSSIEVADPQNGSNYRLQFTATTTDAGIAAARIAVDAARANAAAGKFRLERTGPAQVAPAR
jgi:beta-lactamase regulating signal transducer with metallopeptidase domain